MAANAQDGEVKQNSTRIDVILWNMQGKSKAHHRREGLIPLVADRLTAPTCPYMYLLACEVATDSNKKTIAERCTGSGLENEPVGGSRSRVPDSCIFKIATGTMPKQKQEEQDKYVIEDLTELLEFDLTPGRLSLAKVIQGRLLMASWHGPKNGSNDYHIKAFKSVVKFLDKVRNKLKCEAVLMGGDFNMDPFLINSKADRVIELKDKTKIEYDVYYEYVLPTHRHTCIDYVVVWPQGRFHFLEAEEYKFKQLKMHRAFDHGVIHYQVEFLEKDELRNPEEPMKKLLGKGLEEVADVLGRCTIYTPLHLITVALLRCDLKKIEKARNNLFHEAKKELKLEQVKMKSSTSETTHAKDLAQLTQYILSKRKDVYLDFPVDVIDQKHQHVVQKMSEGVVSNVCAALNEMKEDIRDMKEELEDTEQGINELTKRIRNSMLNSPRRQEEEPA